VDCLPRSHGRNIYRLLVDSAVVLALVIQVVRSRGQALSVARAIGEKKVREHHPKHEANDDSAACPNMNKAPQPGTQRNEYQTKNHSELFHDTYRLSREDTIALFPSCSDKRKKNRNIA
jgi:hypothetical protein